MDLQGPRRSFDIGKAFSFAFTIFGENFNVFISLQLATGFVLAVLQVIAVLGGGFAIYGAGNEPAESAGGNAFLILTMVVLAAGAAFAIGLSQALGAYGGLCVLEGRKAGFRDAWSVGWRNALPAAGIVLVTTVATWLGSLLFLVPGFVVMVFLSMAVPALVIDKAGWGAFGRSAMISENYRLPLLGYLLLSRIGIVVVGLVFYFLTSFMTFLTAPGSDYPAVAIVAVLIGAVLQMAVFAAASLAFGAATAGAYVAFRQKTFSGGKEQMAALFD